MTSLYPLKAYLMDLRRIMYVLAFALICAAALTPIAIFVAITSINNSLASNHVIQELNLQIAALRNQADDNSRIISELDEAIEDQKDANKRLNEHWTAAYKEATERASNWLRLYNEERGKNKKPEAVDPKEGQPAPEVEGSTSEVDRLSDAIGLHVRYRQPASTQGRLLVLQQRGFRQPAHSVPRFFRYFDPYRMSPPSLP